MGGKLRKREEMMKKEEQSGKRGTESWKSWRLKLKRKKSLEGMMILEIEMVIYLLRKKIEKEGMIHPTPRKKMKHLQGRRMTRKKRGMGIKTRKELYEENHLLLKSAERRKMFRRVKRTMMMNQKKDC